MEFGGVSDALKEYRKLLARLLAVRQANSGMESDVEDAILDCMDDAWERLSPGERDTANRVSGRLAAGSLPEGTYIALETVGPTPVQSLEWVSTLAVSSHALPVEIRRERGSGGDVIHMHRFEPVNVRQVVRTVLRPVETPLGFVFDTAAFKIDRRPRRMVCDKRLPPEEMTTQAAEFITS